MDSLMHDCAVAMATAMLEMIGHNFREEQQKDIFDAYYQACSAGLELYARESRTRYLTAKEN